MKDESVLQCLSFYPGQKRGVNSSLLYAISIFCTNHSLRTITKHLNKQTILITIEIFSKFLCEVHVTNTLNNHKRKYTENN